MVYGEAVTLPTPENYTPLQPLSPYGVTKLASEYYLNFYYRTYNISYLALRYANVYGPRQNPHGEAGVVAIFSKKLLKGNVPTINGDGRQTRDYIFVGDVAEINKIALSSNSVGSYNIGTGIETNVLGVFEKLRSVVHSSIEAQYGSAKKGEQKRSCLDCNSAFEKLNWKAKTMLEEGFSKTVAYFKNEGKK